MSEGSSSYEVLREWVRQRGLGEITSEVGFVMVDDVVQLYHDELTELLGALSPGTKETISKALRIALP